ncbi:MAG: hypothetical protein ACKO7O_09315 [Bacteroidota bacterium]
MRNCEHILVLDAEEVREFGKHQELMDQKGLYFEMVQQQQDESSQN